jgi:hypothetical protein
MCFTVAPVRHNICVVYMEKSIQTQEEKIFFPMLNFYKFK